MLLQILVAAVAMAALGTACAQEESRCKRPCGEVTIQYPFGYEGCHYKHEFLVTCSNETSGKPIPILGSGTNMIISNMSIDKGELEIMAFVAHDCYDNSRPTSRGVVSFKLGESQRRIRLSTKNTFVAIGCDTNAYFRGTRGKRIDVTGCFSTCDKESIITNGSCSGVGCCQIAVPEGISSFKIEIKSNNNHTNISDFNPCSYAFFLGNDKFNFSTNYLREFPSPRMPMILEWAIGNLNCSIASQEPSTFMCKGNSVCDHNYTGPGYRCLCREGFKGNPYVPNDCKNINECTNGNNDCLHHCEDTEGNYTCKCPKGYSGDGRKAGTRCTANQSTVIKIALGSSVAALLLLISVFFLYFGHKKRKLIMLREKFFKQNGGLMLEQRISSDKGSQGQAKVFTIEELKRATDNYDKSRIIGKGAYGTVYKGVLSDDRTVAIKKSSLAYQSQSQTEQFINEVVILSNINHRNVVHLIGCCLETEVPLLVYEFVSNGTLSEHLHDKGKSSAITWTIRLRIATDTAEALSYLHFEASVPIIHRDVKPTNILLDDSFVAKVADFGASRLVPMDQRELATMMQGTVGYFDPEYFFTYTLTDKSDVFSFGVVLVEILTGKKVLSHDRPHEERNQTKIFLSCLKEERLFQVIDKHLQQNDHDEIMKVSRLAEKCLHDKGNKRPTMKEVARELAVILESNIHRASVGATSFE